jgi:hypothetical protein
MREKSFRPLRGVGVAQVKTKNGFLDWLVNGDAKKVESPIAAASSKVAPAVAAPGGPSSYMDSSGDDFEEFRQHLAQPKRPFRRPGISIKEEYELWLAAKALGPAPAVKPRSGLSKFLLGEKAE